MPYKDALTFIVHSFDAYIRGEKMAPIPGLTGIPISECGIPLGDKHPEGINTLLNLLQDQRDLTVLQYDMVKITFYILIFLYEEIFLIF